MHSGITLPKRGRGGEESASRSVTGPIYLQRCGGGRNISSLTHIKQIRIFTKCKPETQTPYKCMRPTLLPYIKSHLPCIPTLLELQQSPWRFSVQRFFVGLCLDCLTSCWTERKNFRKSLALIYWQGTSGIFFLALNKNLIILFWYANVLISCKYIFLSSFNENGPILPWHALGDMQ